MGKVAAQPTDEEIFCNIYGWFSVFAAVRNVVFPAGLLEREKMKPIFSTEQARYQKFGSFFIYALGGFAFCGTRVFRALRRATKAPPLETATF